MTSRLRHEAAIQVDLGCRCVALCYELGGLDSGEYPAVLIEFA
jgi:hypothetical protein